jgi:hypothetical protein
VALAVELFGKLEFSDKRSCAGLDKYAHFRDFGKLYFELQHVIIGKYVI